MSEHVTEPEAPCTDGELLEEVLRHAAAVAEAWRSVPEWVFGSGALDGLRAAVHGLADAATEIADDLHARERPPTAEAVLAWIARAPGRRRRMQYEDSVLTDDHGAVLEALGADGPRADAMRRMAHELQNCAPVVIELAAIEESPTRYVSIDGVPFDTPLLELWLVALARLVGPTVEVRVNRTTRLLGAEIDGRRVHVMGVIPLDGDDPITVIPVRAPDRAEANA